MNTNPNTTASGATDLPEFPGHPESQIMTWSALEIVAIRKYGADMFRAGRLAASAPVAPTLAPTDAEIFALEVAHTKRHETRDCTGYFSEFDIVAFTLSAIAKWGAPAPASDALRTAAQAIVDRWDAPSWKDIGHTGLFIDRLREALAAPPAQEARVPLSDYLANDVVDSLGWELDDDERDDMVRVVRATEGAHGITAAQKETS